MKNLNYFLALLVCLGLALSACAKSTPETSLAGHEPPAPTSAPATPQSQVNSTPGVQPQAGSNYPAPGAQAQEGSNYPAPAAQPQVGSNYPAPQSGVQPTSYPAPGQPAAGAINLTDGLKRQVSLPGPAQKIVSLAPSNTEILFSLGAGSQVIGRDEFSDYPAEAKSLPSVGGSMGKYNLEAIAALKPDLVLAASINTPDQVKSLTDLGLNVFYLANPVDLNGMYANLQIVAKLTGKDAQTETLIASLKARVDAVAAKLASVTTKPRVYYELDFTNPAKPYTAGPGSFVDNLLSLAGGENIGAGLKGQYAEISAEEIIASNPQVILLGDAAYSNPPVTPENVAQRPGWDQLDAVKNKQVFVFDDNLVSRPTARLVDGLETLAKLIHPEAFK